MRKILKSIFLILFAFTALSNLANASEDHAVADTLSPKKFNTGELIFDHIKDSYEWHITNVGHTHISIPLPVILYSQHSGLHLFMSGKFHHGTEAYQGYKIASE